MKKTKTAAGILCIALALGMLTVPTLADTANGNTVQGGIVDLLADSTEENATATSASSGTTEARVNGDSATNNTPASGTTGTSTAGTTKYGSSTAGTTTYADNSNTSLTPSGNMTLVDDITTESGKVFYTITTKDRQYFYLIVDKSTTGQNNVYFLNQVDERDLLSLMSNEEAKEVESERTKAESEAAAVESELDPLKDTGTASEEANSSTSVEPTEETGSPSISNVKELITNADPVTLAAGAGIIFFVIIFLIITLIGKGRKKKTTKTSRQDQDYEDGYDDAYTFDEPEEDDSDGKDDQ